MSAAPAHPSQKTQAEKAGPKIGPARGCHTVENGLVVVNQRLAMAAPRTRIPATTWAVAADETAEKPSAQGAIKDQRPNTPLIHSSA